MARGPLGTNPGSTPAWGCLLLYKVHRNNITRVTKSSEPRVAQHALVFESGHAPGMLGSNIECLSGKTWAQLYMDHRVPRLQ